MATVECCLTNVDAPARERLGDLAHDVVEKRCCQRCGDCHRTAFLVVDGELWTGASHGDLLETTGLATTGARSPDGDDR